MNREFIPPPAAPTGEAGNRATRSPTARGVRFVRATRHHALACAIAALAFASITIAAAASPVAIPSPDGNTPASESAAADPASAALARVNEEIARHPQQEASRFERARILESLELPEAAMRDYRWLLDHRPERPEAYNNLSRLLAARGELTRAIALLEQGLSTDPVYQLLFENLRTLYGAMAQRAYRDALKEAGTPDEVAPLDEEFSVDLKPVESLETPAGTPAMPGGTTVEAAVEGTNRMAAREE